MVSAAHILIVEDDDATAIEIGEALADHGMSSSTATTGLAALDLLAQQDFDAIVLDRMLPGGMDGLAILKTLRERGDARPVLILSALSAVDERIRGLRAGGDDYVTKPFDFLELTARLDALLRRRTAPPEVETILRIADLELDLIGRVATRAGKPIELLPREWRLLEHLVRHAGEVQTRGMLFEAVWSYRFDERTNTIDVHISNLRRKLDQEGMVPLIRTVRGSGYMLHAPD